MSQKKGYDLVVVGAGPGGYVAAVRGAQLGMKVACIEKQERLGGVCLNVGCIPSKALLDSSELFHMAKTRLEAHGIKTGRVTVDVSAMMARKQRVVEELTLNVRKLLEGKKVDIIHGKARLVAADRLEVHQDGRKNEKPRIIDGRAILLATGSAPVSLPGVQFDGEHIVSATDALAFKTVPKHLGIAGGGYIGLELGSVWLRLGSSVTVVEMMPQIAGVLDGQVARTLERMLEGQGMDIRLKTKVVGVEKTAGRVRVTLAGDDDKPSEFLCDRLLVAVGRKPLTRELGLEDIGVKLDPRSGQVLVDEAYRTNIETICAVGDMIGGPMLAHKASAEGIAAVERMAGLSGEVNYDTIPSIIYTWPEVASVGLTEEQARARGIPYCTGSYPFSGAGRARCMGETDGFVKILAHGRTDRILGVHIIGPRASDMIAESVLAMEFGAGSEDIARTLHGHPTFAEALQEAAMSVRQCAIYAS